MNIPYHREKDCLLVWHRIACEKCGYPTGEARFSTVEEWINHEREFDLNLPEKE